MQRQLAPWHSARIVKLVVSVHCWSSLMVRQQRHRVAVAGSRITVCVASMDRLPASKLAQTHELPHGLEFSRCTGPRHLLVQRRQGGNPEAHPCLARGSRITPRALRRVRGEGGMCGSLVAESGGAWTSVFVLFAQVRLGHIVETWRAAPPGPRARAPRPARAVAARPRRLRPAVHFLILYCVFSFTVRYTSRGACGALPVGGVSYC